MQKKTITKNLKSKSIPSFEVQNLALSVQTIIKIYQNLASPKNVYSIKISKIKINSDSWAALSWLNLFANKFVNSNKCPILFLNKIKQIERLCEVHPVQFLFILGIQNLAAFISRAIPFKQLKKSNYFSGPKLDSDDKALSAENTYDIKLTNPLIKNTFVNTMMSGVQGKQQCSNL